MGSEPPVRLLDLEPDLIRYLGADQRAEARTMLFPVRLIPRGEFEMRNLFDETNSFGGMLLDGMLIQRIRLGGHPGVRLIGPGETISLTHRDRTSLISESVCRAVLPTRLALLGYDLLAATHRWPMLVAGLHARSAEQADRLVAQLMVCQLPRVEDRVLAMLWLLAGVWGRVTPRGTMLPLALTHQLLGLLVGARRPTVSIALRKLTERGALLGQDSGWLLLERFDHSAAPVEVDDPQLLSGGGSDWSSGARPADLDRTRGQVRIDREAITATFERRREQHEARVAMMNARLAELRSRRERNRAQRLAIVEAAVRRRAAPSS